MINTFSTPAGTLEWTGANPLKDAHAALDAATTAPGIPKHYPDAKERVTADCIRPAQAA